MPQGYRSEIELAPNDGLIRPKYSRAGQHALQTRLLQQNRPIGDIVLPVLSGARSRSVRRSRLFDAEFLEALVFGLG
jgi:hypothetical protein